MPPKEIPSCDPAEAFIAKHGRERNSEWHYWTRFYRQMDPALFHYADRRGRGEEPAPDRLRWQRCPGECSFHRRLLDRSLQVREDGSDIFDTVNYDRPYSGRGASANIGSPVGEPLGPMNETKAQGGWNLSDGTFAVEPLDPRVPGVDYQVVGKNYRQERVRDPKKPRPTWNPDSWEAREPESQERPGARRWSETQIEPLVDLAFQNEVEDWERIASGVGHPVDECQAKWREVASLELNTQVPQAWTRKLETELMRFVDEYGMTDWIRISHFVEHTPEACIAKHAELMSRRQASQSESAGASSSGASNHRGFARPNVSNKRRRNDEDDQPNHLPPKKAKYSNRGATSAPEDFLAIGVGEDADKDEPKGSIRLRNGKRKLDNEPGETAPRGKKLRLNGPVWKDPSARTSGISTPAPGVRATVGTSQGVSPQQPQPVPQSRRILRLRPPKAPAIEESAGDQRGKQAPDYSSGSTPTGKRAHNRQRGQHLRDPQPDSTGCFSKAPATVKPSKSRQRVQGTQKPRANSAGAGEKRRRGKAGDKSEAERFQADVTSLEDDMKGLPPVHKRTSKRLQLKRPKAS